MRRIRRPTHKQIIKQRKKLNISEAEICPAVEKYWRKVKNSKIQQGYKKVSMIDYINMYKKTHTVRWRDYLCDEVYIVKRKHKA